MSFELDHPPHRELAGGDLLAQSLRAQGIDTIFGIHGGHLDAFLMGCAHVGIRLVDTRHETVAVQAAEAYAKETGKIGVCFITANSGFANGLPGIATAVADRSPIFVITSSAPLRDTDTNALQAFHDQVAVSKSMAKYAVKVTSPEEIPRITSFAIRSALSGTKGPTVVDYPIDILFTPVMTDRIAWGSIMSPVARPPGPNPAAIEEALDLIKGAERPVVITGTGCSSAEAGSALQKFIEQVRLPVMSTAKYTNALAWKHELYVGYVSNLTRLPADMRPDLVILVGARPGMFLGNRSGRMIPKTGCKLVHVDLDGSEMGRVLPTDVGIVSDAALALDALSSRASDINMPDFSSWTRKLQDLAQSDLPFDAQDVIRKDGRTHPYLAIKAAFSALPAGSILVLDGGETFVWSALAARHARAAKAMVATGYLGFLGNGFGYALGAAIANPGALVVNIQGDGSSGFHIAELDTYKRHDLRIMTIVVNNFAGMSINGQELMYPKDTARPVANLSEEASYSGVGSAFGQAAATVSKLDDIAPAVKKLLSAKGPSTLELRVSPDPICPSTQGAVNPTSDKNTIVIPYYDNVSRLVPSTF